MPRFGRFVLILLAFAGVFGAHPALAEAQQSGAAPAPIPAQILTVKKVFISNGGIDVVVLALFKDLATPDQAYNELYAAMKGWGRYEIVGSPADADLVLEIRFTSLLIDVGNLISYVPQLELAIFDAKTHFRLWTLTENVESASRKPTWERNFLLAMGNLIVDFKKIAPAAANVT
jgi:hypothetical protein